MLVASNLDVTNIKSFLKFSFVFGLFSFVKETFHYLSDSFLLKLNACNLFLSRKKHLQQFAR